MSLFEIKVVVVCSFGLGFLAYVFTPMVFRFMAQDGAAHFLRWESPIYQQLIPGRAMANGGIGGPDVNNALGAARCNSGILQVLLFMAAGLPLIRSAR